MSGRLRAPSRGSPGWGHWLHRPLTNTGLILPTGPRSPATGSPRALAEVATASTQTEPRVAPCISSVRMEVGGGGGDTPLAKQHPTPSGWGGTGPSLQTSASVLLFEHGGWQHPESGPTPSLLPQMVVGCPRSASQRVTSVLGVTQPYRCLPCGPSAVVVKLTCRSEVWTGVRSQKWPRCFLSLPLPFPDLHSSPKNFRGGGGQDEVSVCASRDWEVGRPPRADVDRDRVQVGGEAARGGDVSPNEVGRHQPRCYWCRRVASGPWTSRNIQRSCCRLWPSHIQTGLGCALDGSVRYIHPDLLARPTEVPRSREHTWGSGLGFYHHSPPEGTRVPRRNN